MSLSGVAIILVEQNTEHAITVADRVVVIEAGNLTWSGTSAEPGSCRSNDGYWYWLSCY
jgi:ABC-type branched-subunit amino acid transport system ATPase component